MICKGLLASMFIIASGVAAVPRADLPASNQASRPAEVVIPFELINRHILMKIRVNDSEPLSFIFDTGDRMAIIDMERAKALGLNLQGEINVGGAGAGSLKGAFIKGSSYTVPGLEGFTQPVALALPLEMLKSRFGQNVDGILGSEFIKQFVIEVDYIARQFRLRDKEKFVYAGPGEAVPVRLNSEGHPIIEGEVTVEGRDPIKASFVIDLGSGAALALHRPFVEQNHLPAPNQKTIRLMGAGGAGGEVTGRIGRVAALRFGKFTIDNPVTLFAADAKGAFATNAFQGNIGQQIMEKFKIILDYSRNRIILEPNARFNAPIGVASAGLTIVAEGADYKTFRIKETLENAPGAEAGLQKDDLIIAVDGQPANQLTLSKLIEMFEREGAYKLTIRRGEQTLRATITPRRLV